MFGIKRLTKQVRELLTRETRLEETGLNIERIGERITKLEDLLYLGKTVDMPDEIGGVQPVRYPFDLSAKEIIARFDEIYDRLGVYRKRDLPRKSKLVDIEVP